MAAGGLLVVGDEELDGRPVLGHLHVPRGRHEHREPPVAERVRIVEVGEVAEEVRWEVMGQLQAVELGVVLGKVTRVVDCVGGWDGMGCVCI